MSYMCYSYHIFGLNIKSVIPLPAIPDLHPQTTHDVAIMYGKTPDALANPQFKGMRFQAGNGKFLLRVDGVGHYYVQDGRCITIMPEAGTCDDDILVFLMGSAMGALLHQRNILVLHAGAIAVNGQSVLFSGSSGIGKSTLTAGFHHRGYPFLADDVCAITVADGQPAVIPGFPRLKLWADVLKKLNTATESLKSVRWGKDLQKYFLPVESIQNTPVPIKSIFIIETTNTNRMEITALNAGQKIYPIIDNTYRMNFLEGLGGKIDHFRQCAAVAAKADVYQTVRPKSGFLLNELMEMLEARFLL
ncbi:MAG: hypothetical protein WCR46_09390 [Deltaproteobacteria bacterium]